MSKFFNNFRKNYKYMKYAALSELKTEVASSYLGWIWWILQPFCFMLIYVFISKVVFKSSEEYFETFVFIGLAVWDFFSRTLITSVRLVKLNNDVVTKVYIPKYILLFIKLFVNLFKFFISLGLVFAFMLYFKVPFHLSILYIIPLTVVLSVVTFGCSVIMMHLGVFIEDLHNVTNIVLRLVFYLSGIFFNITKKIKIKPWGPLLLYLNPIAFLMSESRNALIYNTAPNFLLLFIWLIVGIVLSAIGISAIHKYENTYVKVMK